jgi:hypothetical protein
VTAPAAGAARRAALVVAARPAVAARSAGRAATTAAAAVTVQDGIYFIPTQPQRQRFGRFRVGDAAVHPGFGAGDAAHAAHARNLAFA